MYSILSTALSITICALALCACSSPTAAPLPTAPHHASANEYIFPADQWLGGNGVFGTDWTNDGTDILLLTSGNRAACWGWGYDFQTDQQDLFDTQRPVSLAVDAVPETGDGVYWIGLTNATTNRTDWLGPCTGPQTVPLNDATHRDCLLYYWDERYAETNPTRQNNGHLDVAIYRASGVVRVRSLTVTASSDYLPCNPHRPPCVEAAADATGVTLNWLHVEPLAPEDAGNCAATYEIWRKPLVALPVATSRALLGTVDAPIATYLDATAEPGTTYSYYVRAVNPTGGTSTFSEWAIASVPEI